ncbi:hypothetical protein [Hyalangium minutum]|uniref:Uncharacterized protein n=1 Tax=Hyalangium minutum TaxID=394096 RepID=A0A085WJS0_9BACT|nr:hypothetical protein [Hyalangium minutum]KFE67933.1 hypothetical protein DB31_7170 [Hyalangium minutum]
MHRLYGLVRPLWTLATFEVVFVATFLASMKLVCGRIAEDWDYVRGFDSLTREIAIREAKCFDDHVLQKNLFWLQVLVSLFVGGLVAAGVFQLMKLKNWPKKPRAPGEAPR